jgi:cell wall-associated NlpC family hydrolase
MASLFPALAPCLLLAALLAAVLLAACGTLPSAGPHSSSIASAAPSYPPRPAASAVALEQANGIVLFALGLIDTGYRFGGKNPAAGFDCSGMVSYIFEHAAGLRIQGSAADIARHGKPVDPRQLRPGDLVFFNTQGRPFSHVGIYIGDQRFVHAPSSSGSARVRTESLANRYFAARLEAARSLLD